MKNKKNIAAFFDFDLTVTNYDSFKSFLSFLYLTHPQKYIFWPYLFIVLILKKIKILDLYKTKSLLLFGLKNSTEKEILKLAEQYLSIHSDKLFNIKALKKIDNHLKTNDLVFVISSSPDIIFDKVKSY